MEVKSRNKEVLPKLASGEFLGCWLEPDSGSDPGMITVLKMPVIT
jgi:alkylation response protein AidB-like acyl-CoA dehydrogenase